MEYFYARINNNGFCEEICTSVSEVNSENMIPIKSHNIDFLSKKFVDGEFIEAETPEVERKSELLEPKLTENEIIMLALADLYGEMQGIKERLK